MWMKRDTGGIGRKKINLSTTDLPHDIMEVI